MLRLPDDLNVALREHVNTHMLAMAGMRGSPSDVESWIADWLRQFAGAQLDFTTVPGADPRAQHPE